MKRVQLALFAGSALVLLSAIPAVAQLDPTGEWAPRFHEDQPERIPGPEIGDYLGLPINAADRLKADTWDASLLELPEHQCMPHPSDYAWRGPANLRIWKEIDRQTQDLIAYHTHISWQAPERTIWMDGRPHPPAYAAHTWQGFSTGHWDGDTLTIDTDHLKMGWIRRNGVARSPKASVIEHRPQPRSFSNSMPAASFCVRSATISTLGRSPTWSRSTATTISGSPTKAPTW